MATIDKSKRKRHAVYKVNPKTKRVHRLRAHNRAYVHCGRRADDPSFHPDALDELHIAILMTAGGYSHCKQCWR